MSNAQDAAKQYLGVIEQLEIRLLELDVEIEHARSKRRNVAETLERIRGKVLAQTTGALCPTCHRAHEA